MFIALDKQNIQATIEIIQKIVGVRIVKPLVDFKKPLDAIPRTIAKIRNIYPVEFAIKFPKIKFTLYFGNLVAPVS